MVVADEGRWQVDDHRAPAGQRPVLALLDGLSKSAKAKIYAAIEKLAQRGNRLGMPLSKPLGKGLHELRIPHPEGPFRIIYCFLPGRRALLLHAFVKRTEETPKQDMELARQRQPG